ncbi:glycosyl hydrolase 108 family protein [Sphingomonas sp. 2R-10]|uniref:glycoside hydrolase family 108 protein n=1 Tax=Sphingomonas sp. 2R-10 TaxID=3045148 RepID=UPI000F797649|nr:N-acetylmuramidase [Sphingomonas sp. 2R-10]MDJ0278724.1 glycosyl hydrolase 108 family protein [Sphingomonas sp. 2R-10]
MDVTRLIDDVIDREGGYVDHPADRGGPTRYGITQAVARAEGYTQAMRDLPRALAARIYRRRYWQLPAFDRIATRAPALAAELFDTGVNMGPAVAATFLQRVLNALNRQQRDWPDLTVDANIGARTLTALDTLLATRGPAAEAVLVKAINVLQGERYLRLAETRPANEAFLYGWLAQRTG